LLGYQHTTFPRRCPMLAKLIGGEAEHKGDGLHSCLTDSGRSSLRLLLRSGFNKKRFLLPDYLCKIIPEVFDEFQVDYSYYHVHEDMSFDIGNTLQHFDVLYVINYFGQQSDLSSLQESSAWILEDNVFLPIVENRYNLKNWIGFNSFRKISSLADGSIIRATCKLKDRQINKSEACFATLKYEAKKIKYEYFHSDSHSEQEYLKLFAEAEQLIDDQREIFSISNASLFNLLDFYLNIDREYQTRNNNCKVLDEYLAPWRVNKRAKHPSLYAVSLENRDNLRQYLFKHNIFLPVHWPKIAGITNLLYDKIISIPMDSRYGEDDMRNVVSLIRRFYGA